MHAFKLTCNAYAGILMLALSLCVLAINYYVFQYPENIYLPSNTPGVGLILVLIWGGCHLQFGPKSRLAHTFRDVLKFFLVLLIICIASTAIQFTPFNPIDHYITQFESSLHINMNEIIAWTQNHPRLNTVLDFAYYTLAFQLTIFPIILVVSRKQKYFSEFCLLMFIASTIGFAFYYFFPTTAPASVSTSPLFSESQRSTGIKFYELHNHIPPSTADGGMIALPSFHVIWAWIVQYTMRVWPIVFIALTPLNILLVISCVMLGWHYPVDIVGSIIVILISHYLAFKCKRMVSH
jgi:hypothetical protein